MILQIFFLSLIVFLLHQQEMLSPLALKKRKLHGFLFVEIALFIHTICRFFVYRFKIKNKDYTRAKSIFGFPRNLIIMALSV